MWTYQLVVLVTQAGGGVKARVLFFLILYIGKHNKKHDNNSTHMNEHNSIKISLWVGGFHERPHQIETLSDNPNPTALPPPPTELSTRPELLKFYPSGDTAMHQRMTARSTYERMISESCQNMTQRRLTYHTRRKNHHAFVWDNSPTTAVAKPATIAKTPKTTMTIGTKKFREAHKRSASAGWYSTDPFLQAALACRSSGPLDFMCSSGGSM